MVHALRFEKRDRRQGQRTSQASALHNANRISFEDNWPRLRAEGKPVLRHLLLPRYVFQSLKSKCSFEKTPHFKRRVFGVFPDESAMCFSIRERERVQRQ
jgi:hypothetical protein